jgi:hypothetical protein
VDFALHHLLLLLLLRMLTLPMMMIQESFPSALLQY